MPQRQSPRVPLHLKTTVCSEANGVVRHSIDRSSPKLDDRRSPRSPMHEKKRGTRVADLETKLTQTQEEVKKLKEQLASVEAAKKDAQQELEKTRKLVPPVAVKEEQEEQEEVSSEQENTELPEPDQTAEESINSPATDVFEVVPVKTESIQTDEDGDNKDDGKEEVETKAMIEEESNVDVSELNVKLEALVAENEGLKKQAEEARQSAYASLAKEEEMKERIGKLEEELRESWKKAERLEEKVEASEGEKETIEAEMKKLRVQTEQWRKAAEAAAAVLSAGEDGNRRRVGERCGSMDKHINVGFVGSPGLGMGEEEGLGGGGKRRSSGGMKMFGDLWKKKGHNK